MGKDLFKDGGVVYVVSLTYNSTEEKKEHIVCDEIRYDKRDNRDVYFSVKRKTEYLFDAFFVEYKVKRTLNKKYENLTNEELEENIKEDIVGVIDGVFPHIVTAISSLSAVVGTRPTVTPVKYTPCNL